MGSHVGNDDRTDWVFCVDTPVRIQSCDSESSPDVSVESASGK